MVLTKGIFIYSKMLLDIDSLRCKSQKIDILIVDDEPDIVSILKLGLMRQGFNVIAFTDPNLALGHFRLNQRLRLSDL
jgi:DNA-binding NtrC family response regulator